MKTNTSVKFSTKEELDKFILNRLIKKPPTATPLIDKLRTIAQQKVLNLKK